MGRKLRLGIGVLCMLTGLQTSQGQWGRPGFNGPVLIPGGFAPGPAHANENGGTSKNPRWHIEADKTTQMPFRLNDGQGFPWVIHQYGYESSGRNNVFSNAMYLNLSGSGFTVSSNRARLSDDAREVEVGPCNRSGVNCYRRIRIYRNHGLARWVDIFENTSNQNVTLELRYGTVVNTSLAKVQRVEVGPGRGRGAEGGIIAQPDTGNYPPFAHLVFNKGAALKPHAFETRQNNNRLDWTYRLEIPAGKSAALCHFAIQGDDTAKLTSRLERFRPWTYLEDLPAELVGSILNFRVASHPAAMLERSEDHDTLVKLDGKTVHGQILPEPYRIRTLFGKVVLPPDRVLGVVRLSRELETVLVLLDDGQAVAGTLDRETIRLEPTTGGEQSYPISHLLQWSSQISRGKPARPSFRGPRVQLDSGDLLRLDPQSLSLALRTVDSMLQLDPAHLHRVRIQAGGKPTHRVIFANGSTLSGMVLGPTFSARLDLGFDLEVPLAKVRQIQFTPQIEPNDLLTQLTLADGEELYVQLENEPLELTTSFGQARIHPESIQDLYSLTQQRAVLKIWNGSTFRGRLANAQLRVQIVPGPWLQLDLDRLSQLHRPHALPPREIVDQVARLVESLDAPSYEKRQEATDKLKQMGQAIRPLLQRHKKQTSSLEVRNRIEDILEIHSSAPSSNSPAGQEEMQMMIRGNILIGG